MGEPEEPGWSWRLPAAIAAGLLACAAVAAWQGKSIDIPGIADDRLPILSDEPSDELAASADIASSSPQQQCVDAWNSEKHDDGWFAIAQNAAATTGGKAAVTVDEQGICVVAIPSTGVTPSGENNGATLSYERGSWDHYAFIGHEEYSTDPAELSKTQGESSVRFALIDQLEAQALAEPNATLLPDGTIELLSTTPGLPQPAVESPDTEQCDETVGFLDGVATLEIEEAEGLSCTDAAKVAETVPDPEGWACDLVPPDVQARCGDLAAVVGSSSDSERWACDGDDDRVVCETGGLSFVFLVSQQPVSATSSPSNSPDFGRATECGEVGEYKDISVVGIECETVVAGLEASGSVEGYGCEANYEAAGSGGLVPVVCKEGGTSATRYFGYAAPPAGPRD
jgi:hypothetical protein